MAEASEPKRYARDWIDDNRDRLAAFEQEIWDLAEPAWREYRSAEAYVELLRDEGFQVETGTGDMPTAFLATYGDGEPVIATYAECDAVPANSQKRVPRRQPRDGVHPYAAGHTDPHSVLGVGTLGGALAAKAAMDAFDLEGTLKYFGEPAEKVCGSKPIHAAKGYYDDLDAAVASTRSPRTPSSGRPTVAPTGAWSSPSRPTGPRRGPTRASCRPKASTPRRAARAPSTRSA